MLDEIARQIQERRHQHVVLWFGSIISARGPTACAEVPQIRDDLVIAALQNRTRAFGKDTRNELARVLGRLRPPVDPSQPGILDIPFERLMSCLASAEDDGHTAIGAIRAACLATTTPRPSNLHKLLKALVQTVLDRNLCEKVTVVTTNYDLLLESAFSGFGRSKRRGAVRSGWQPLRRCPDWLPGFSSAEYERDRLCLLKVHGSIDRPESLVFTADRLAEGMLDFERFAFLHNRLSDATCVLFAGYGFNDPDLRPALKRLLVPKPDRVAIRIDDKPDSEPNPRVGMQVLRKEFLDSVPLTLYRCNLFDPTDEHFFIGLARRLRCFDDRWLPLPTERWRLRRSRSAYRDHFAGISEEAAIEFVARLCDALGSGEAHRLIHRLVLTSVDSKRRPERMTILSRSLTSVTNYRDQVSACQQMRRKWSDPDTRALTLGFESFAHTIGSPQPSKAMEALRKGRALLARCKSPVARTRFQHYDCHYWAKVLQYIDMAVGTEPHRWGLRACLRPFARRLLSRLQATAAGATITRDVQFVAEIRDLEAQLLLYTGMPDHALEVAETCQQYYSAMGLLNGMALIDRTIGWIRLGRGERAAAIRAFARGLHRALHSPDSSLAPKLAANLARALAAEGCLDVRSTNLPTVDQVAVACGRVAGAGRAEAIEKKDAQTICRSLRRWYRGTHHDELMRHMVRFACLEQFPIFHPPRVG